MDAPGNSIFSGPITSTFNAIPFDRSPFTRQCEKEDRKTKGFQILHFDWSFSDDTVAVNGLIMYQRCAAYITYPFGNENERHFRALVVPVSSI